MSEAYTPKVRVDWTVPIWGVLGMLVQGLAIVWWTASLSATVSETSKRVDKLEVRASAFDEQAAVIARLDERTKAIYDSMQRADGRR